MKPLDSPVHEEKRGGWREGNGRPPATLKAVKYGSTRTCKKCGRFVSKAHDHRCGDKSLRRCKLEEEIKQLRKQLRVAMRRFKLPSMPPDLQ